jgi:hypothetical protein
MFKNLSVLILGLFVLSACTDPAAEVDAMIEDGDLLEAVEWMDEEVENSPTDPLFNGLAAEIKTRLCIQNNCTEKNPEILIQIAAHLKNVTGPVETEDGALRNIYANLLKISRDFKNDTNHPEPIIAFVETIPAHIPQDGFAQMLMDMAVGSISKIEVPATLSLLKKVEEIAPSSDYAVYTPLIHAMISNDTAALTSALAKARQPKGKLTLETAYLLPYAFFFQDIEKDSNNGAFSFVKTFNQQFKNLKLSKTNYTIAKPWISTSLKHMANNKYLGALAIKHIDNMKLISHEKQVQIELEKQDSALDTVKALETPTATEEMALNDKGKKDLFKLYLFKTSLIFNPDQKEVWHGFLQPAMDYVDTTGFVDLLFTGIDQTKIPKDAIAPYNKKLFAIIENKFNANENAIFLLHKIIIPEINSDPVVSRLDALLTKGINKSIKKNDYKQLVGYASFKPKLARPFRQKIAAIIKEALNKLWLENQFDDMAKLANFLEKSMEINIILDNLLITKFQEFIVAEKIPEKISADTADILLKKQNEVRLDLGEKFAFLSKHFAKSPEVLDGQLKTLVLNAKGAYGTPVAFFKLYHLFNDRNFSMADRNEFLVGAIKDSLEKNEKITASEMVDIGYKLVQNHPDIPLIFVVSETLKRITSLDESRIVWKNSSREFREKLKNVKPQFTTLMEAIHLFDAGKKKQAFEMFSILSDEKYLKTAEEYITKFRKIIGNHKGIFIADNDVNEKMHAVFISVEPLSDPKKITSLLDVKVKIINAIGSVMIKSDTELTEDYGRTFSYTSSGKINPDLQILPISEEQRAGATLPQSFERTFGEIIGIKFAEDKEGNAIVLAITTDGTTYPFHRITSDIKTPLFPQGRFGITKQISGRNKNTDHVMPIGTVISVATDEKRPIQPVHEGKKLAIVYPITGEILHPSSPNPRQFTGFYGMDTHTMNFEYDYPLNRGSKGTLKAINRCQVLDKTILCASHNKHWSRLKYSHIVKGYKAQESTKQDEFEMTPEGDNILKPPSELQN